MQGKNGKQSSGQSLGSLHRCIGPGTTGPSVVCLYSNFSETFKCYKLLLQKVTTFQPNASKDRLCSSHVLYSVGVATWTMRLFVSSAIISPSPCISSIVTIALVSGPMAGRIRKFCGEDKPTCDTGVFH